MLQTNKFLKILEIQTISDNVKKISQLLKSCLNKYLYKIFNIWLVKKVNVPQFLFKVLVVPMLISLPPCKRIHLLRF